MKTIFYSFATLIRKILFSPLEDKIHIHHRLISSIFSSGGEKNVDKLYIVFPLFNRAVERSQFITFVDNF